MVSEKTGNVLTDLSGLRAATLSNLRAGTTISSGRYFTVKLGGGSVDVSDVLYTDDHDSVVTPLHAGSEGSVDLGGDHRKGARRQTRELRKL
jgi:hypothetical protein